MKKFTKEIADEYVDHLIKSSDLIKDNEITILTGSNGSGKSLVRKLLSNRFKVASTSMERRAGLNMHGAMGAFLSDADWEPTSLETIKLINGVLSQKERFLVIDEPEIGMGEETVLGLCKNLNKKLKGLGCGVLIITHSRLLVENLKHDLFINLDGMTREEWLNRKVVAVDLEEMQERSSILFRAIQDRINKNSSKKD